jgi:glycyl-tRNA synthetase beta chain
MDTLLGFFVENLRPTGSSDPYALRRAALGVIRIVLDNDVRLHLIDLNGPFGVHLMYFLSDEVVALHKKTIGNGKELSRFPAVERVVRASKEQDRAAESAARTPDVLLEFFADRLKVALREKGVRHDLIDAVFALGDEDDLVRLVRRVEALQTFLKTDDGANLLTGYKRAANILKIEEKKDKKEYRGAPEAGALKQDEEKALAAALATAKKDAAAALSKEDFAAAMKALAKLRAPVDRFFEKVTVNADDKALRENRLKLLSQIVETAHQVADFSKIEG